MLFCEFGQDLRHSEFEMLQRKLFFIAFAAGLAKPTPQIGIAYQNSQFFCQSFRITLRNQKP
jgi:hypothetical protein